jgi:hypothetical protein
MNKQPKDQPESNSQPRDTSPISYSVTEHHKARLKHPTPSWRPASNAKRLELGHRIADAINSVAEDLAYDIDNNLVANIRSSIAGIEKIQNWFLALKALSQEYTDVLDFAYNGPAFVDTQHAAVFITKLDDNAVATLGPVTANLTLHSGLLGLLIKLENDLKTVPAYNANQDYGIRLGFITAAPPKPDLDSIIFEFTGFTLLNGHPAVKWNTRHKHVDGGVIEFRELNDPDAHWHPAATTINNPTLLAIPRLTQPRDVELRGRYFKHNQQRGDWSLPYRVTIPAVIE